MKVEMYDPAMCCPTGICGPAIDPALVRMNDAVMLLQRQCVEVVRFGLAQQTRDLLQAQGKKALPITLVNGVVFRTGAYPSYEELCAALGILFFSGKGGVGKTTTAAATTLHHARSGRRTLIVTTDPASNLADVFEQAIGHRVVPIHGVPNLHAMEIEPDAATREYRERLIAPYRGIMPEDVIASLEENLSGPCTTEMASFERFIDFMEGDDYEVIVFDTAPTGHTIRLLELPVEWSRHIEQSAKGSGQTCLGPVQTIQDSKEKFDRATALLRDPARTTFVFVMRPERLSLYETRRARRELETVHLADRGRRTLIVTTDPAAGGPLPCRRATASDAPCAPQSKGGSM